MRTAIALFFTLLSCQSFCETNQFTLDNGLKILVREDHRAPVVVSMIWYNVGSADEPGGITGISHVMEHMMFKGTKKYPSGLFSKIIAALGGQENALTSNDYTAFYEKMASSNLAVSFKLEADRMHHLSLSEKEFSQEIKVIQEERRMRTDDNPLSLTFERFFATAQLSAPYHHPVVGWMSDLHQMQVSDVKRWYQRYYAPNNATLVVIGDVQSSDVLKLANKYFGKIPKKTIPSRKLQQEPEPLGQKSTVVHAEAEVPTILMGYTVPTVKMVSKTDPSAPYVLELIAGILSAGDSSRFTSQLIGNKQVASHLEVLYNLYARYQTQFVIYGSPSRSGSIKALKEGVLNEIQRLKNEIIDEKELQRVKTQIIAQKTFERDSIFSQAMELGILETIDLGWQTSEKYVDRINKISALQVQKTARRYFQENHLTEALLIPNRLSGNKQ